MPSSRFLIASNTLGSSAASVTFSSIPATYTDLVLKYSARGDSAVFARDLYVEYNGDTATNYSQTLLEAPVASSRGSNGNYIIVDTIIASASATSSTFTNGELYIPSYTVSQNKPQSHFAGAENNSSTTYRVQVGAFLWRNTAALTSIKFSLSSGSFVSGSTFWLYGLKNS
jgi:hypothetical protein